MPYDEVLLEATSDRGEVESQCGVECGVMEMREHGNEWYKCKFSDFVSGL